MKTTKTKNLLLGIAIGIGTSFATVAQNVPSYVPTNGLVGWWPFNGNANDESGNNNNGTVNGASLTSDRFGNVAKAYSFDGVNDYILCSPNQVNLNGNSFSWSLWLKNNSLSIGALYIAQGTTNSNNGFHLGFTSNSIFRFGFYNNDLDANTSNTDLNNWFFYAGTYDASTNQRKLYINGVLNSSDIAFADYIGNGALYFGGTFSNTNGWAQSSVNGKLDDIGIWNRALTQQEITDLYNANICYQHITVTDTLIINTNLVGFNPVTYQNTIKIFPNPTSDHITINYGNFATLNGYQLKIINSLGQQMFQTAINQQSSYINLINWTGNGIYFVQIIDPQGNIIDIRKIVLQ
jgi:hypothetical protein